MARFEFQRGSQIIELQVKRKTSASVVRRQIWALDCSNGTGIAGAGAGPPVQSTKPTPNAYDSTADAAAASLDFMQVIITRAVALALEGLTKWQGDHDPNLANFGPRLRDVLVQRAFSYVHQI